MGGKEGENGNMELRGDGFGITFHKVQIKVLFVLTLVLGLAEQNVKTINMQAVGG